MPERKKGPIKTGDSVVDITALILYVAPQLTGERPFEEDTGRCVQQIVDLQRSGKLNDLHRSLLMKIQFFKIDGDLF